VCIWCVFCGLVVYGVAIQRTPYQHLFRVYRAPFRFLHHSYPVVPCARRPIIASKYRPLPILKQALYVLQPSSSFVVFHEFLEPLVDCYLYLQANALALRLVLSDTWMREFQTLPGRVRPDMFMSTSGGFILSGIYVGQVPCAYVYGSGENSGNSGEASNAEVVADTCGG
jgi:hypothetical protein